MGEAGGSGGGAHQRRAGYLKQLAVLSSKNFKLKKSQTCCCCTCPFVPILFELLLPVALCVLFSYVSQLIDTSAVAAGWSTTSGFSGTTAKTALSGYYHTSAGYATASLDAGPGQGMWSRVAPLAEYLQQVDSGKISPGSKYNGDTVYVDPWGCYDRKGSRYDTTQAFCEDKTQCPCGCPDQEKRGCPDQDACYTDCRWLTTCNKIALAPGRHGDATKQDVLDFQKWVTDNWYDGSTGLGVPAFDAVTTVFESEQELEDYVGSTKYLGGRINASQPMCAKCTQYNVTTGCRPNIASALVLGSVGSPPHTPKRAKHNWAYSIRMNVTFRGDPNANFVSRKGLSTLTTLNTPAVDVLQRFLVPTGGAAYASLGFMSLQQLMDRYIMGKRSTGAAPPTAATAYALVEQMVKGGFYPGITDQFHHLISLLERCQKCNDTATAAACKTTPGPAGPEGGAGPGVCPSGGGPLCCDQQLLAYAAPELMTPASVNIVALPIAAFTFNTFYDTVAPIFPLFFLVMLIMSVFLVHSALLTEKETKMREMLRIMGVSNAALMSSWYGMFALIYLTFALVIAAVLKYGISGGLLPESDFSLIVLFFLGFLMCIVAWAYAISPFASSARNGSIGGTILFFGAFFVTNAATAETTLGTRAAMSLLPPCALAFGIGQFSLFESGGVGVQWTNINTEQQNMTFGTCLLMLWLDIALYSLLGWYFDQVVPQEFGATLPPHFFLMPSYWRGGGDAVLTDEATNDDQGLLAADHLTEAAGPAQPTNRFEPVSVELRAQEAQHRSVTIARLSKRFSTPDGVVTAVNDLSFSMYEGQIFCLLGHNGAGKTTTISMLTGMLTPSGGDAIVAGDSIRTHMAAVRESLSVCPQHDVLYPNLTVEQHLRIFGELKGLQGSQLAQAIDEGLKTVGLTEKRHAKTMQLSGGMKRKLSVAMALLADTKFTFLDEPTSGMDPYSRRSTWDVLQNARAGRVLLLTTHFMDEADLLGDRIGIMAHGELKCCGSPLFLKNRFGGGYALTVVKCADCDETAIAGLEALVKKHVPAGKMTQNVGTEAAFQLPIVASASFPALLAALDAGKGARGTLRIEEFGISVTTMEEVFIRVARDGGEALDDDDDGKAAEARAALHKRLSKHRLSRANSLSGEVNTDSNSPIAAPVLQSELRKSFLESSPGALAVGVQPAKGVELWGRQFYALLMKRVNYGKRDRIAVCLNTICPSIFIAAGLALLVTSTAGRSDPPYKLSMAGFNDGDGVTVPVVGKDQAASAALQQQLSSHGLASTTIGADATLKAWENAFAAPEPFVFPPLASPLENKQWPRYEHGLFSGNVKADGTTRADPTPICADPNNRAPPDPNNPNPGADHVKSNGFCRSSSVTPWRPAYIGSDEKGITACDQAVYSLSRQICGTASLAAPSEYCNWYNSSVTRFDSSVPGGVDLWHPAGEDFCTDGKARTTPLGGDKDTPSLLLAVMHQLWLDGGVDAKGEYKYKQSKYGALVLPTDAHHEWFILQNTTSRHAAAIFTNLLASALYANQSGGGSITVTNHPLPIISLRKQSATQGLGFTATLIIMVAFAFIPAGIAAFVVRERETAHNSKHQQLLSGASIPMYWLANYTFDLVNYLLPFLCALVLIQAFGFSSLIDDGAFGAVTALLVMFGVAMVPWTYALSFLFEKHTSAQVFSVIVAMISGIILMIAAFVMSLIESTKATNADLLFLYYWFPPFCLGWGLYQIVIGRLIAVPFTYQCIAKPELCAAPGLYALEVCGYPLLFLGVSAVVFFGLVVVLDYANSTPRIRALFKRDPRPPAAAMRYDVDDDVAAEQQRVAADEAAGRCDDIVQIRGLQKVYPAPAGSGGCSKCALSCCLTPELKSLRHAEALRKVRAGPKVAVKNLSFGVAPGECFGFLGINGAGKTSTLKMLTGDYLPSTGTAVLGGHDILAEQLKVRAKLGYCPQFDALLDRLSVREHLELFARIKGIPSADLGDVVQLTLREMDLKPFEHKLAGRLSGGNKRKLSVAIAMIGSPPIVFLDEPSTGMDPVARRFMWDVIAKISTRSTNESAVVLTTHLMEECEALCSRVGIMVGGRLRCLGSVQHLKSKFGRGLMAEINLETLDEPAAAAFASSNGLPDTAITQEGLLGACSTLGDAGRATSINVSNDAAWSLCRELAVHGSVSPVSFASWWVNEDRVRAVDAFVRENFAGASLVERHESQLRFRLPGGGGIGGNMPLSKAFDLMEGCKRKLHLREYALSQTTLEQIFNQFAAQQEEETGGARGIVAGANPATSQQQQQQQMMTVTVPEGVVAGQTIAVTGPAGVVVQVAVPEGVGPGEQFTMSLGAPPGAAPATDGAKSEYTNPAY